MSENFITPSRSSSWRAYFLEEELPPDIASRDRVRLAAI
jgi:hypothetical protein